MNLIRDGELTIKGKDAKGQEIVVEAPIRDLEIEVRNDYEPVFSWDRNFHVPTQQQVTFKAALAGEGKYTVKAIKPEPVERTARVLGWEDPEAAVRREPTIALIKAAAEKAGVDENTDFILVYDKDIRRQMNRVYVEFRWTD